MRKIEGILVYDYTSDRYQVEYGIETYTAGLHAGETLQAEINGRWIDTRIEMSYPSNKWCLVGIKESLNGLRVRYMV